MHIRRLTLTGFKSFVDRAELVIAPGLTGIVGPNGCGKSNLLEAIRWVMGEASPRSLRGGGMEDVIFAGTARRPARDFAEVAMLVERDAGAGAAEEAEIVRRIERGAGSAYRLDGGDVRQKDVALLFADAATGAHSPALVSQGRIGAIIAARPADRRAMLEEAAGIAGLHVRRRDAEQKLRATEANLERLDTLIGDMDARVGALRRQARAAQRYRALSVEIRLAEARLIWARWRDAAAAAEAARRDADAAGAVVAETGEAHRAAAEAAATATADLADARAVAQAARDAAGASSHRLDALRAERSALDRRIAETTALRATLERDRSREGALAQDAADALARLATETETLGARLAAAAAARTPLADRAQAAEQTLRDAEIGLARATSAQAAEQADARIAQAALAAARGRIERIDADALRVAAELASLGDEEAYARAIAGAVEDRERAAERERVAATATIDAEAAREAAETAQMAARERASAARVALAALDAERRALERSLPPPSPDRALDLLTVASGYERALAAALGDDLDAPVASTGPLRWTETTDGNDPVLPPGCVPLADHVGAPAALVRRLAQIAVVDRDDGTVRLAAGQRLVTRDGRLRRWDGFVAEDRGAATAQGLVRRNRLAEILAASPAVRAEAEDGEAALAAAGGSLARASERLRDAREAVGEAATLVRAATVAEDRARIAHEGVVARRAEVCARRDRIVGDRAAASRDADAAAATVAALPDAGLTAIEVAGARAAAEEARAAAAALKVEIATLDRTMLADRERRDAAAAETRGWRSRAGDAARRIAEMAARAHAAEEEAQALAAAPAALDQALAAAEATVREAAGAVARSGAAEAETAAALRSLEARLAAVGEAATMAREARATAVARLENQELRRVEMGRIAGERFQCPAALLPRTVGFDADKVGEVAEQSQRFERLGADRERLGPVNLVAEQELADLDAERAAQSAGRDELAEAVARLRGSIGSLNREGRTRLKAAFEAVDGHFRRLFARLFGGGEAHLALIDSDDPLEAGLEIMAQPPGKRLSSLTLLSGGEQALTACALIFALFLTSPAPICVLDEVDAPLDDANIERFCDLLDQMVRETKTRYLVVTHNAVTMARMHRLFGVTMVERGVSRLVSVDLGGAEHLLAAE